MHTISHIHNIHFLNITATGFGYLNTATFRLYRIIKRKFMYIKFMGKILVLHNSYLQRNACFISVGKAKC